VKLFQEPLVRVFLIGGAIVGLYALVNDTPPPMAANAQSDPALSASPDAVIRSRLR
jgi:hypothetical protein